MISNTDVLPYRDAQGMKCLEVQDLPAHLDPKAKKSGKDKVSCFLCNAEIRLSAMRNHVGSHILCDMRGVEDEYSPLNISEVYITLLLYLNILTCFIIACSRALWVLWTGRLHHSSYKKRQEDFNIFKLPLPLYSHEV